MRICAYSRCDESMEGRRKDALYCKDSHRALDHRRRVEARIRHEAMRELAAKIDPSGEILEALDDLEATVPDFAIVNDAILRGVVGAPMGRDRDG